MSDIITAPLKKHPWYKRTWGIILIIVSSLVLFAAIWFGFEVYSNIRQMKAGTFKPISNFSDFTTGKAGVKTADGSIVQLISDKSPARGPDDAKITIVQFGDFQCPFSGKEFPVIRPYMETMKNVKFVYRDFPLVDIHPDAFRAAEASHCAQDQNKYWAYHDQLFLNQSNLTEAALESYAKNIGLDMDLFKSCLASETHKAQVLRDVQDGLALGVKGTPTFFINGVKFEGAVPKVAWDIIFDRLK
jgi:protein-disulfide isomerase